MAFDHDFNEAQDRDYFFKHQAIPTSSHDLSENDNIIGVIEALEDINNQKESFNSKVGFMSFSTICALIATFFLTLSLSGFLKNWFGSPGEVLFWTGVAVSLVFWLCFIDCSPKQKAQFIKFKWIKKTFQLFPKFKKFKHIEQEIHQQQQDLDSLLNSEKFQHDYITRIQLKAMDCKKLITDIGLHNQEYYFDDIEFLQTSIHTLAHRQSLIIKLMMNHVSDLPQLIMEIKELEKIISDIDSRLQKITQITNNPSSQDFIERHKKVLDKKGLSSAFHTAHHDWQNYVSQHGDSNCNKDLKNYL